MNGLGFEGAMQLEETLCENVTLRFLDVSNNRINWEGVTYVARGLKNNSTLKVLKVGDIIHAFPFSRCGVCRKCEHFKTDTYFSRLDPF